MSFIKRIAWSRYLRAVARYMYVAGAWYARRRSVTKVLLLFTFLILPVLLYTYVAIQPLVPPDVTVSYALAPPNYATVDCTTVLRGRVFIAGPFSYSTCYYVNETHVLFSSGLQHGVIVFVSSGQGDSYGVSFVHDGSVESVSTRYLVLVAVAGNEDAAVEALRAAIEERGLGEKLCRSFLPSTSFGGRFVHHRLYSYFCLPPSHTG